MIISKKKFEMELNRRLEKIITERNNYERMDRMEENLHREMNHRDERIHRRITELQKRINAIDHMDSDKNECPFKPVESYESY